MTAVGFELLAVLAEGVLLNSLGGVYIIFKHSYLNYSI